MNALRLSIVLTVLFITNLPSPLAAKDRDHLEVLSIDEVIIDGQKLTYPNEERIVAEPSDFTVLHQFFLSSKSGTRRAVLTIENTSTGQRVLKSSHLLGVFANGDRKPPTFSERVFSGSETITLNVMFGKHRYPLIAVETRQ